MATRTVSPPHVNGAPAPDLLDPAARRLLIVAQPLEAGVPRHVLDLVQSLDPARYAIDVACPRASVLWRALAPLPNVRRHAIAPHREPSLVDAVTWVRLLRLIRGADVIHAHSSKAGFVARLAAVLVGRSASCIFTPHGWSFWAARGARARVYRSLERAAARWCDTILAVSEHERHAGLASGIGAPAQYRVVLNGVDLRRFALERSVVHGRIIMVGRLDAPKRPDLAIRAVAALRPDFPHIELRLAGDGPQRPAVEALIARLGLQDRVRLLGMRDDVPELLARAECVLFASDYEACPLSVIEAMAAGVPIVATRVGGVSEIVEPGVTGALVDPDRPDALAAGLRELLADPDLGRRMGATGRARARTEFSSDRMAAEIAAVYASVAPGHRRARPAPTGARG